MITRKHLRLDLAIRYSWKNILYSTVCWGLAYSAMVHPAAPRIDVPISVIAILGTALAIILAFRNSSAYERWWEARKIWGGIVNESRTLARQLRSFVAQDQPMEDLRILTNAHLAWVNALRLQLRQKNDPRTWKSDVYDLLLPALRQKVESSTNKVTRIGHEQGIAIRSCHDRTNMEPLFLVQLDDTLTRLTDLQGRAERIRNTPLPRPYDYYTLAFLNIFIFFFPFGVIGHFDDPVMYLWLLPITIVVGWIFYQIYVFGKVLSHPFQNWRTDVPLDAICRTIEIDLKEMLGDKDVPTPVLPERGVLM